MLKPLPPILDATCGSRMIWFNKDCKDCLFCDLPGAGIGTPRVSEKDAIQRILSQRREKIAFEIEHGVLTWPSLLECEILEALAEIDNENTPAAVEECYDAIAVLLRVIDVLEGRQPLGKPAPKTPTPPPKQTPPKSSAAPETARNGKPADGSYEYPPIDPDCGVMFCRCPGHEPHCAACMICRDFHRHDAALLDWFIDCMDRAVEEVFGGLPEYKKGATDAH